MDSAGSGDETIMTTYDHHSREGFQIKTSEGHLKWLTVGELIRAVQKPISIYAEEIVKAFHEKLCKDLLGIGKCTSPEDCNQKTRPADLCPSCRHWFNELGNSHEKGKNPAWHKNCNSARWSEDHWELAKFFMPPLGDNLSTVKDAESTDLPSLLNVLEWMKDTAFLGKTRVNVDLVRKLRSEVRNTWAHAPKQELTDDEKEQSFSIVTEFLEDLENVFPKPENGECLKHLKELNDNGVTNVFESELRSLLLQRKLLCDIKDEIIRMKVEQSSTKDAIEQKLEKLERALNQWSQRMSDFQSLKDNIDEQYNNIYKELKCFRAVPDEIHELRESVDQILGRLSMNDRQNVEQELTSCLPEKVPMFTAREVEIQKVIRFLMEEEKAIVSLHGGPGFGKTSIAVEVSHKLDGDHNIPVVFSHLSTATSIHEMVLRLCCDVGVNCEDDPAKSSFILWLKNIKKKVVFVLDNIDNVLEKEKTHLFEFLRLMRKNSRQHCQIVTTSRSSYSISELSTAKVQVDEMDNEECMKLLNKRCPEQKDEFLSKLAELCGKVPLAMCIASSRFDDFKDSNQLLQHLKEQPMETLESPESDQYVYRAINMSYEMLDDDQKEDFVRLAVFEGNFDEETAKAVIEKEDLPTKCFLKNLVCRSLMKQHSQHRYSIHPLIQCFLINHLKSKEQKAERLRAEVSRAKALMVKFYLDLGHDLTIKSYSKDGFKDNRETLKKEAHNIQNVLKMCCQQEDTNSDIFSSLASSKIYNNSANSFTNFVRTVIPLSILDEFLQCCATLARERKELAIKINFDCLLAERERCKSIGISDKYVTMMEKIEEEFNKHYEELKQDKQLCAHYYYQYGQFLLAISQIDHNQDLVTKAREQLENSLSLRKDLTNTSEGQADLVHSFLQLGNIWKIISRDALYRNQTEARNIATMVADFYYKKAIELSQEYLGEHGLTSACYKTAGDFLLLRQHKDKAHDHYIIAKEMRERLGLDASEKHVYLLNNLGKCLTFSNRPSEAIKLLETACDMAEKLAESDKPNVCKAKVYSSLAIAHNMEERYSENAVNYARKAMGFDRIYEVIKKRELHKLELISQTGNAE